MILPVVVALGRAALVGRHRDYTRIFVSSPDLGDIAINPLEL